MAFSHLTFAKASSKGSMACNFTSNDVKELASATGNPHLDLAAFSTDCAQVCALVYGKGNPDLAGIGMVVFYTIQVSLSTLYGPIFFVDLFFLSARRGRRHSRFTEWLLSSQELFFFSQLWFTLATSTACFVLQVEQTTLVYQSAVAASVISMGLFSLLITLAAFYQPFQHLALVFIAISSIAPLSIYSIYKHQSQISRFGHVMGICSHIYGNATPSPHHTFHRAAVFPALTALVLILPIMWLPLWWRRGTEKKANGLLSRPYTSTECALGIAILLGSTVLAGMSISLLISLRRLRGTITRVDNKDHEEDVWGIGQISAIFAWAPVLVDMAYKSKALWAWHLNQHNQSESTHIEEGVREDGHELEPREIC